MHDGERYGEATHWAIELPITENAEDAKMDEAEIQDWLLSLEDVDCQRDGLARAETHGRSPDRSRVDERVAAFIPAIPRPIATRYPLTRSRLIRAISILSNASPPYTAGMPWHW
jgi:hypothetical protein